MTSLRPLFTPYKYDTAHMCLSLSLARRCHCLKGHGNKVHACSQALHYKLMHCTHQGPGNKVHAARYCITSLCIVHTCTVLPRPISSASTAPYLHTHKACSSNLLNKPAHQTCIYPMYAQHSQLCILNVHTHQTCSSNLLMQLLTGYKP